jgi:hypothetical protein
VSNLREREVIGDVPEGLLSPRQEQALRSATVVLLDRFFADVGYLEPGGDFADTDMVAYLPARFLPKYNHLFAKEFLVALSAVASKLVQPGNWPLACVAEELALNALIEEAESHLEARGEEADLGDFRELATKDKDYMWLFDMAWDGIEDSDLGRQEGVMNLAFDQWFEPFYEGIPVHPYVEPDSPSLS